MNAAMRELAIEHAMNTFRANLVMLYAQIQTSAVLHGQTVFKENLSQAKSCVHEMITEIQAKSFELVPGADQEFVDQLCEQVEAAFQEIFEVPLYTEEAAK